MSMDHGPLSGIRKRSTPRQERQHAAGIERRIDQAKAEIEAQEEEKARLARLSWAILNAPVPYTGDELKAATHIRVRPGWYAVVKVNKKSVTVDFGYGQTHRYPLARILEVRTIGETP